MLCEMKTSNPFIQGGMLFFGEFAHKYLVFSRSSWLVNTFTKGYGYLCIHLEIHCIVSLRDLLRHISTCCTENYSFPLIN